MKIIKCVSYIVGLTFVSLRLISVAPLQAQESSKSVAGPRSSGNYVLSPEQYDPQAGTHSTLHSVLLYLPNRVLDIFDIFRLRLRIGPGFSAGARATKIAQAYVGSYVSLYAGLPGPRLRAFPKLPIGLESYSGADLGPVELSSGAGLDPGYSDSEIGAGFQLAILGLDFGIDPVEIADFFAGVFTVDIREDDL